MVHLLPHVQVPRRHDRHERQEDQQHKRHVGGHQPAQDRLTGHAPVGQIIDDKYPQGADHADGAGDDEQHQVFLSFPELKQLVL